MATLVHKNLTVLAAKELSHLLKTFLSFQLWIKIKFLLYINYNILI